MSQIKLAAIQMTIASQNQEDNLSNALSSMKEAASKGANIVCLPELFTTGFDYEYIRQCAAHVPNKITETLAQAAKNLNIHIVAGSIPTKIGADIYNTTILFDDNGNIIGKYSKLHLFPLMDEDKHFTAGDELPVFTTKLGQIGVMICYDLRFPEMARKLALSGAEIIFVPSEFPNPRIEHWKTLLRARAIENQLYVVGVNRVGKDSANTFFGHSCIINPWGEILAQANDQETIIDAEIDLATVHETRKQLPCLARIIREF